MSSPPEVHFEVSVLDRNGEWEVVDIQDNEIAARAVAKSLLVKGGIAGVRVAMEAYSDETQRFHGRMLWETMAPKPRRMVEGIQGQTGRVGPTVTVNNVRDFKPSNRRPSPTRPSWWRRLLGL